MRKTSSEEPGAYSHYIDHTEGVCYVKGKGSVNSQISQEAMDNVNNDPEFSSNMNVIVDLREIYYHPTYEELMAIKEHLRFLKENFKGKIALVSSDELYYVVHMICMFCNRFGLKMRCFKRRENAKIWISNHKSITHRAS